MLHTYGSVLKRIKNDYSKDKISKEQLLDRLEWLIREEGIRMLMNSLIQKLCHSDKSLKDIPKMLSEEQKKLLRDNWGHYCDIIGITVEERLIRKLRFSLKCMIEYKPKELLERDYSKRK